MSGMVHVLCNKIPEVDDIDGGMSRRLRCIPYGSSFVEGRDDVASHVYAKQFVSDERGVHQNVDARSRKTGTSGRTVPFPRFALRAPQPARPGVNEGCLRDAPCYPKTGNALE